MQTLEGLLQRFAKRTDARWWVGKRPNLRDAQLVKAIADQVGLPTSADDPFAGNHLIRLCRAEAAHVLAVAGTTSLAYEAPSPASGEVEAAKAALDDLAGDATFLSNGRWRSAEPVSWSSATSSTFDCGLLGYDQENAFIFWAEEED